SRLDVIRVAAARIGCREKIGTALAEGADHGSELPGLLVRKRPVGKSEVTTLGETEDLRRLLRLALARGDIAGRGKFPPGEVDDHRPVTAGGHSEKKAARGNFGIIGMRDDDDEIRHGTSAPSASPT